MAKQASENVAKTARIRSAQQLKTNYGAIFATYLNMAQHNVFNILSNISERLDIEDRVMTDDAYIASAVALRMLAPQEDKSKGGKLKYYDVFIRPDAVFSDGTALISLPLNKAVSKDKSKVFLPARNEEAKQQQRQIPSDKLPFLIENLKQHIPVLQYETDVRQIGLFLQKALRRLIQERNYFTHAIYKKRPNTVVGIKSYTTNARDKLLRAIENGLQVGNDPYRGFTAAALEAEFGSTAQALVDLKAFSQEIIFWGKIKTVEDFTDYGLAFLICLFLEKKYATQFLAQIGTVVAFSPLKKRFLEEWMWQFCCRIPRPRLESSDPTLDFLNELGKCPIGLYDQLSSSDKALFHIKVKNKQTKNKEHEDHVRHVRFYDRSANLLLEALEENNSFERLRFQIHLGKYLKKTYYKDNFGQRKIYQNLRAFGKLAFYKNHAENAPKDWKKVGLNVDAQEHWYVETIEQFRPRYHISGNRIGIKLFEQKTEDKWWSLSDYQQDGAVREKVLRPDFILSTHDIPNLAFYQYLHHQGLIEQSATVLLEAYQEEFSTLMEMVRSESIKPVKQYAIHKGRETIRKFHKKPLFPFERPDERKEGKEKNVYTDWELNNLEDRKEELQAVLNQKFSLIKVGYLPDSLREYLLGYKVEKDLYKLKRRIVTRRKKTEKHLRTLEKEAYRMGNALAMPEIDNFSEKEVLAFVEAKLDKINNPPIGAKWRVQNGDIADWLMRDIVFLKPRREGFKNEGMPNGQESSRLQKSIAYFSLYKKEIAAIFKDLGFVDKNSFLAHPFLQKTDYEDRTSVRTFYEAYLRAKVAWLDESLWQMKVMKAFEECDKKAIKEARSKTYMKKRWLQNEIEEKKQEAKQYTDNDEVRKASAARTEQEKAEKLLAAVEKDEQAFEAFEARYAFNIQFYDNESKAATEKDYKNLPLMLPRGLFLSPIRTALSQLNLDKAAGFTQILEAYFEGKKQSFYSMERNYRDNRVEDQVLQLNGTEDWKLAAATIQNEIDSLQPKAAERSLEEEELQMFHGLKNILRQARKQEKQIRYQTACDRLLMLLVQQLCAKKEAFELKKDDLKIEKLSTPTDSNNLLNEEVEMSITLIGRKIVDKLPIKRHGDFRRFFKDKRLQKLLLYYPTDAPIHRDILLEELDYFDRQRHNFFQTVIEFEQALYHKFPEELEQLIGKDYANHSKQLVKLKELFPDSFKAMQVFPDLDAIGQLLLFRNKFSHNEIPFTEALKEKIRIPKYYSEQSKNLETGYQENHYRVPEGEEWLTQQIIDLAVNSYQQLTQTLI